jgi:anti-anti-sigma factor
MAIRSSRPRQDIGLIEPQGAILGGEEVDELRQAIRAFVDEQCPKLIIDLSLVPHASSTAVGVLVAACISYTRERWQLKICGVNKIVYAILVITKLNLVFDVVDTREDAIRSFQ